MTGAATKATVIAATAIRVAPEGFDAGYVLALVATEEGRRLVRLDLESPPSAGQTVTFP